MSFLRKNKNQTLHGHITTKYLVSLSIIGFTLLVGYFTLDFYIKNIPKDFVFVRLVREQQMLSQRILLLLKAIGDEKDPKNALNSQKELGEATEHIEFNHKIIVNNTGLSYALHDNYFGKDGLNDKVKQFIFDARHSYFASDQYLYKKWANLSADFARSITIVEEQINQDMNLLYLIQRLTLTFGILALIFSGIFIFKPMVASIVAKNEVINKLNKMLERRVHLRTQEVKSLEELEKISVRNAYKSGMSEMATEVLHNIGNILNSMNVSLEMIIKNLTHSELISLHKANALLKENTGNIEYFLTKDPKGKKLIDFYLKLDPILKSETKAQQEEANDLMMRLGLIKGIISTNLSFSKNIPNFMEDVSLIEIADTAIAVQEHTFLRYHIAVEKNFCSDLHIFANKAKLTHVIVNLLKNAKEAILEQNATEKRVRVEINLTKNGEPFLSVGDTGTGITKENLEKLYTFGFTTKKGGHGFGLHSSYLTMKEMQGKLSATSEGIGHGSQFTITFPKKEEAKICVPPLSL